MSHMNIQLNRRMLRGILGVIWLLDGLFQLQPGMWTMDMVTSIMQPNNGGQPGPVHAFLTWATNVVSAHLIVVNSYVAVIQVLIGISLLFNFFPRTAIVVSVIHGLMVWAVGEGFGVLLTGNALFLMGAPGAVLLYVLLGIAAWPKEGTDGREDASPPARWLRYALGAFWLFAAALQLQPGFLASKGLSSAIDGMAAGQPGPLHASIHWVASSIGGHGLIVTLVLAAFQLALAIGVTFARDLRPWLIASAVWCLVAWWFGQALGMLLTGMGTDPQTSPLVLLLILVVWYQQQAPSPEGATTAPAPTARRLPDVGTLARRFGR